MTQNGHDVIIKIFNSINVKAIHMKQILQNLKTGDTILEEVPVPAVGKGKMLIRSTHSLVSLGTERMLVEFGKANLIQKAQQQPDKVKQVLDKIRTEGLIPTLEAVFNKLDQPLPLGYCNVGIVEEVGEGVTHFKVGDRVASNGPHAEWVVTPQNLTVKIPDNVNGEEATFTVIGSIGLQGIRLVQPTFGETIVVYGLGLIGLITTQLLKAQGCNVIGIDLDVEKCKLAESWGIITLNPIGGDDIVKSVKLLTNDIGADGVIITASAKSNEIIRNSAQMSRKRGRIVLVGVIGLDINRADFYEKELSFQVSCSYGPGRYDELYEHKGIDYPPAYVRWTENRNFEAILKSISNGSLQVKPLITESISIDQYREIYDNIDKTDSIASILNYSTESSEPERTIQIQKKSYTGEKGVIGIIGAGNFTKMTMLPALKKTDAIFDTIASAGGVNATSLAKKFGFSRSTTSAESIFNNENIDSVFITTRHNSHAHFVNSALANNKHVFVEKPLAITFEEIKKIIQSFDNSEGSVMVGYNRRFSPHMIAIKNDLGKTPINIVATMNAGFIPKDSWLHDPDIGGGRILGEACHYMDLCCYLTGSTIESVCMNALGDQPEISSDNASILLKFENGSNAVVNYFSNGSKSYSKERIEVYCQERTYVSDNFRRTVAFGSRNFRKVKSRIDKGHKYQFKNYIHWLKSGGEPLIPFDVLINSSVASLAVLKSLQEKRWVQINEFEF